MANSFFLDASALAKRYVPERGSAQISSIIDTMPGGRLYLLIIGTGEIVSILVRKHNAGVVSDTYFRQALANFESEIVHPADITKVPVTSSTRHRLFAPDCCSFDQLHGCSDPQIGAGHRPEVTRRGR